MIVFLLNVYLVILAIFVWMRVIPFNLFWKLSPVLVLLILLISLFIPMGWGAPWGSGVVVRNSVQIVPEVAGEVIDVPVVANVPLKSADILFRIDRTPYEAQARAIEARLKFAELRLSQFSQLQQTGTGALSTWRSGRPRSTSCAPSSTAQGGISKRRRYARRPTVT